ncbi:arsenic resistance protein [Bacillus alkalisoli]|uniref:arsenic resistance protein n=1 Tax=Bacillus alkalisoli TaxID=2011008 RepID=UPI000C23540B|nr:bile acid:sodium symporter [Bacillus alkalisoli]
MSLIEKMYTFFILSSVIIGIVIGQVSLIQSNAEFFIVPILVVMLYFTFLQIPLAEIKRAFKNTKFTYTSVIINFVWIPVLAWILASVFLGNTPALYIGFIMLMVTPCTDWYLIFTGLARGNVSLSTAILPLNLILQVLLLPFYLLIFGGMTEFIKLSFLVESILFVLFLPLALAIVTKRVSRLSNIIVSKFSVLPIILLNFAIMAMFASQGHLLISNIDLIWKITIPILLFFVVNFFVGQMAGKLMKFSYPDRTSLSLTTLARNSPVALAIAMTAFPDQPLIALTLVIGPLLELPILAIITQVLLFLNKGRR